MLGNINFPVRCALVIELKNGNKFRFTCQLPENEKQIIEKLYELSTRTEPKTDPRQLNLHPKFNGPMRITTVSGRIIETVDGIKWEEVKGVPSPMVSDPNERAVRSKADCNVYGYHCGSDKCPFALYECVDREKGIEARVEADSARSEASQKVKKKRGRPSKKDIEARKHAQSTVAKSHNIETCKNYPRDCDSPSCPLAGKQCHRRAAGRNALKREQEIEQSAKMPKHSGELCRAKVAECEFCSSTNCVHCGRSLMYWSICKGERFPEGCLDCHERDCLLHMPPKNRVCKIETAVCSQCENPYCRYSNYPPELWRDDIPESSVQPVYEVFGGCDRGVSVSCLDECQDTGCRYHHGLPLCKLGFPEKCSSSCEQSDCVFHKWDSGREVGE